MAEADDPNDGFDLTCSSCPAKEVMSAALTAGWVYNEELDAAFCPGCLPRAKTWVRGVSEWLTDYPIPKGTTVADAKLKFADLPKFDKSGRAYQSENARVKSVTIDNENHGSLTAWLHLEIGTCMGCGFGGFKLGHADRRNDDAPGTLHYMAEWVMRCINTLTDGGFGTWEGLADTPCRVLTEGLGGGVFAVGHFLQDKWFCPKVEFAREHEGDARAPGR